ncbi:MAG: MerR family transcriptional regulator [Candidatus Saccharibacteria bacterium]|nr:MerR family transcriptional regulator [Candidatus Saccharibacteria bacterium]
MAFGVYDSMFEKKSTHRLENGCLSNQSSSMSINPEFNSTFQESTILSSQKLISRKELLERSNIGNNTLIIYAKAKLIETIKDDPNQVTGLYKETDIEQVNQIKALTQVGYSYEQIKILIKEGTISQVVDNLKNQNVYTINQLLELTGCSRSQLERLTKSGLIAISQQSEAQHPRYDSEVITQIELIKNLLNLYPKHQEVKAVLEDEQSVAFFKSQPQLYNREQLTRLTKIKPATFNYLLQENLVEVLKLKNIECYQPSTIDYLKHIKLLKDKGLPNEALKSIIQADLLQETAETWLQRPALISAYELRKQSQIPEGYIQKFIQQDLIQPTFAFNGRDFFIQADISLVKNIHVFLSKGFTFDEIKEIFKKPNFDEILDHIDDYQGRTNLAQFSQLTQIPEGTIRFYHQMGLLTDMGLPTRTIYLNTDENLKRLDMINQLQACQLNLKSIKCILDNPDLLELIITGKLLDLRQLAVKHNLAEQTIRKWTNEGLIENSTHITNGGFWFDTTISAKVENIKKLQLGGLRNNQLIKSIINQPELVEMFLQKRLLTLSKLAQKTQIPASSIRRWTDQKLLKPRLVSHQAIWYESSALKQIETIKAFIKQGRTNVSDIRQYLF